jgi:hypothetical protein
MILGHLYLTARRAILTLYDVLIFRTTRQYWSDRSEHL